MYVHKYFRYVLPLLTNKNPALHFSFSSGYRQANENKTSLLSRWTGIRTGSANHVPCVCFCFLCPLRADPTHISTSACTCSVSTRHSRSGLVGEVEQDPISKADSQFFAHSQNLPRKGLRHKQLQFCCYGPNNFVDPFWYSFTAKHSGLAENETKLFATHTWSPDIDAICHLAAQPVPADRDHGFAASLL